MSKACSTKTKQRKPSEIQAFLEVIKSTEATNTFISVQTRGGFVCPCDDLIHIVEVAELSFRGEINKINDINTLRRSIPTECSYLQFSARLSCYEVNMGEHCFVFWG